MLGKAAIEESGIPISEVVSGGATGVDQLAILYARKNHLPFKVFRADWNKWGKAAGPIRNREMAQYVGPAGALVAVWDGVSRGTNNMILEAKAVGAKVSVYTLSPA